MPQKIWFITGASSGFGRGLAKAALDRGDRAMLTARNPANLDDLVAAYPGNALAAALDVTKSEEIQAAVDATISAYGGIDILANVAGYGLIGAVEECTPEEYRPLFEVNLFGLIEVTRAALPSLRERKGRIVQFSSTLGMLGRAGFGLYSAAKFAVEGLSEALAAELEPLGLRVIIVEPGAFRTDFLDRSIAVAGQSIDAYGETAGAVRTGALANNGHQSGDPAKGVLLILQALDAEVPPLRLALGPDSYRNNRSKIARATADYDAWAALGTATSFDA
ncbi:MAG: short-chain dehydrogenase/reductase [Proteobacteria bacterium ST_bin13]|nr:MAG: short-chain dehydrogenase/reductase [Proteobacteria bacterium ST_bin13]